MKNKKLKKKKKKNYERRRREETIARLHLSHEVGYPPSFLSHLSCQPISSSAPPCSNMSTQYKIIQQ